MHTLFHGTQKSQIKNILANGFTETNLGAKWFQMSTDFESALFHCSTQTDADKHVYVIEFEIASTDEHWEGYPTLWPFEKCNENSKWAAVKEHIPAECIKAVYQVPIAIYLEQKNKGFNKSEIDLIKASKDIYGKTKDNEVSLEI